MQLSAIAILVIYTVSNHRDGTLWHVDTIQRRAMSSTNYPAIGGAAAKFW
jgi:hypothetical protein